MIKQTEELLSTTEARDLVECERRIETGLTSFLDVGNALKQIQECRLYRATHKSFNKYLQDRWQMTESYAYRLISAFEVTTVLQAGNIIAPTSESVARPLTKLNLDPKELSSVWSHILTETDDKPTAQDVTRILQTLKEDEDPRLKAAYREMANKQDIRRIEKRQQMLAEKIQQNPSIHLDQQYQIILADPPWESDFDEEHKTTNHYPTMSVDEIKSIPVNAWSTDDSVLFLWTTSYHLLKAPEVIKVWGYEYKACAVWDKGGKTGMGHYFRINHELLLVATKGNPTTPTPPNRSSSVIRETKTKHHSQKPISAYTIIEKMYPLFSKLELFARNEREGWTSWGNETKKFDAA